MNVLFLSPDFVLPAERGVRVRLLSQLRVLAGMKEVERVTVLSLSESVTSADRLRELERFMPKARVVTPIVRSSRIRSSPKAFGRFLKLRLVDRKPYVAIVCENDAMHALVRKHLTEERVDVVYLGNIGMMAYVEDVRRLAPRATVVLEQHNVEWQVFDRLADSYSMPLRHVARWEAHATRRFERASLRAVDSVIAISESDAHGFRELAGIEAIVVPPFVPVGKPRSDSNGGSKLGYIGMLSWQPNAYGLDWFCREVWPHVRVRVPNASLTIAGTGLRKRPDGSLDVPKLWEQPGIKTVGFVEDLEDVYRDSVAMVAPVVGGSGVRMKLLETMSAGMPTVTTSDGAAGLGIGDGVEVLVADDPKVFAEKVARVLSESALRDRLRLGGYRFLEEHHSVHATEVRLRSALAGGRCPHEGTPRVEIAKE